MLSQCVVVLAPGLGSKQMLYTKGILQKLWDQIGIFIELEMYSMILIEFEYVSTLFHVSLALAHMTICKTSALINESFLWRGSLWWFTPWQDLEGVLGWCLQQDIEHTLTISVFALQLKVLYPLCWMASLQQMEQPTQTCIESARKLWPYLWFALMGSCKECNKLTLWKA